MQQQKTDEEFGVRPVGDDSIGLRIHDEPMADPGSEDEPNGDHRVTRGSLPSSYFETVEKNETFRSVADSLRLAGRLDVDGKEFTD